MTNKTLSAFEQAELQARNKQLEEALRRLVYTSENLVSSETSEYNWKLSIKKAKEVLK